MNKFFMGGLVALGFVAIATPAMAETVQFELINNSSHEVHYFYTSPSDQASWGSDLLGDNGVMVAGATGTVTIGDDSDQCLYDFKFVIESGAETVVAQVNICELNTYTLND